MEKNKVDIVYVLGEGSAWNNNEIRFSLRSLEKNLQGFSKVFIVGSLPDFLQNVIHVPAKDIFNPNTNADGNIILKVLEVCKQKGLSDEFLFINDDHLVIKPLHVSEVPPFHKGDMTTFKPEYWALNFWRGRLNRTMQVLKHKGLPTLHFDCHTPILFNKYRFPGIMKQFKFRKEIGYTMKSLYGNIVYPDAPKLEGQKKTVFTSFSLEQINQRLEKALLMSFNDDGLNNSLKYWLFQNFKEKSRFETNDPEDKTLDIAKWDLNGRNYYEGVQVFTKYFKNRNLVLLFNQNESPSLKKKLDYKLNQIIKQL